ncbi:hypothetical protein NOS3756_26250 [Nostoc sp. NIES-3756]|uniref:heterocyst-inhibiting protein PatX n=1 Tax=Nostoc sp. NIES-3756 TaxID=1751286 RepID=UPI00071F76D7|nr:hypothetical protein [Nostoc sp. NIES-3756]BAT53664.1 hypothetical protein NOS3756_26250 [Nostoc sp. NIES-3756]BAY38583.1 hypothetical protein NIES2111_29310 [Nostoc sp. NIES-2111]
MRAAVPVLVTSLVFGSLIFDSLEMVNRNSNPSSNTEYMASLKYKPKRNQPEKPVPHRGTGRRSFIENTQTAV